MKGENGCFLLSIPKLLLMKTNFYLVIYYVSNAVPNVEIVRGMSDFLTFIGVTKT